MTDTFRNEFEFIMPSQNDAAAGAGAGAKQRLVLRRDKKTGECVVKVHTYPRDAADAWQPPPPLPHPLNTPQARLRRQLRWLKRNADGVEFVCERVCERVAEALEDAYPAWMNSCSDEPAWRVDWDGLRWDLAAAMFAREHFEEPEDC